MITWKNYLARKGLTTQAWLKANGVTSVHELRVKASQLRLLLQPADEQLVRSILTPNKHTVDGPKVKEKTKPEPKLEPVVEVKEEVTPEPVVEEQPRRRRRKESTTTEE